MVEDLHKDFYTIFNDIASISAGESTKYIMFRSTELFLMVGDSWFGRGETSFHICSYGDNDDLYELEKEFLDPLEPTTHELTLFEINHGIPYPLIPYLKCLSHTQQGE